MTTPYVVPPTHQANGILCLDQPKQEQLAVFHHVSLGSLVVSTLLQAIPRGHIISFPGLTTELITKHLPKSVATVLEHQDQEAQNICCTRVLPLLPAVSPDEQALNISPPLNLRSHPICATILHKDHVLKSYYSDQTGLFPIPSSHGNHYVFILYQQDTNKTPTQSLSSVPPPPPPNRKVPSICFALESTHRLLVHQGHATELHILDNECSQDLKNAFASWCFSEDQVVKFLG